MKSYEMHRVTIVAPAVKNDGSISGYPAAMRDALLGAGIDGWTEYETVGSWNGKRGLGTVFEIYLMETAQTVPELGAAARGVMPDQEAIQITVDPAPVTLYEA